MGRRFSFKAAIIACALVLLAATGRAAQAQPQDQTQNQAQNDDRYGFIPLPAPVMPAAGMPAQQAPLPPPQTIVPPQLPAPAPAYQPAYGYVPAVQTASNPDYYYPPAQPDISGEYRLGSGDKLRVSVFGEDDLTGEYQIDGSGMVRLPLIGTLRAAGLTAPGLEYAIGGALARGYLKNPRVNVEITTYRPFYILGAVSRPGEYPYVDNMSTLNAVAYGGGFTDQAKQSVVYIRHENSTVEEEVPASQLTRVLPGDVVRVKSTMFWDVMSIFSPLSGPAVFAAATLR